ncbi:hypothetical protein ACKKBG_A21155 [Auxenochlorella protothecoides x Auxenochlorella symbiontica]
MLRRHLLALTLLLAVQSRAWGPDWVPWTPLGPSHRRPEVPDTPWSRTVDRLWNATRAQVAFCVGDRREPALGLLAASFPWPLPSGPASEPVCASSQGLETFLCRPAEIESYARYMLPTENPEKVPDTPHCRAGNASSACSPGFFDANPAHRDEARAWSAAAAATHPCCEGYFCPSGLDCVMPCPLGAYCPRAVPAPPPPPYRTGHPGEDPDMWCAPYAYKRRAGLGCGGADKWGIVPPEHAFPVADWSEGTGSVYCRGGSYCPTTLRSVPCPARHFCRQGTTEPEACPPGAVCPPGTEIFDDNFTGFTIDFLLILVLCIVWQLSQWYRALMRRLSSMERLAVTWGRTQALPPPDIAATAEGEAEGGPAAESTSPGKRWGKWLRRGWNKGSNPLLEHLQAEAPTDRAADGRDGPIRAAQAGAPIPPGETMPPPRTFPATPSGSTPSLSSMADHANGAGAQPPDGAGEAGPAPPPSPRPQLHIEFFALGLALGPRRKAVLQGVTGCLAASRLTAIMGPSGAGKTTLLNVLAGRAQKGRRSGEVRVNGVVDRLERYKRVTGFVPQDDIMHPDLTVAEALAFAARVRLPSHTHPAQHEAAVKRTLRALGLEGVADSLIGDPDARGISGGQKKRVSIGLELVADPALLLLDEPTSGLDASASRALVAALRGIVRRGVTAAAVVHQPSAQVLAMLDDVLLLGAGGRTVFYGPAQGVQAHFEGLGYVLPPRLNPADAFLDIITGDRGRGPEGLDAVAPGFLAEAWAAREAGGGAEAGPDWGGVYGRGDGILERGGEPAGWRRPARLCDPEEGLVASPSGRCGEGSPHALDSCSSPAGPLSSPGKKVTWPALRLWRRRVWEASSYGLDQAHATLADFWSGMVEAVGRLDGVMVNCGGRPTSRSQRERVRLATRAVPGFLRQYRWCLGRAALQRSRDPVGVLVDTVIIAVTGMTLGLLSDRGRETIMHYAVSTTYSVVAVGLMATVGGLSTFGTRRLIAQREAAAGLNRLAFFLALDSVDAVLSLIHSAVYLVMWYSFAVPRAVVWQMYAVTAATVYACTGMAYLLSQVLEPGTAQLAAAVFSLLSTMIARQGNPSGAVRLLQGFSFARWALEGMVVSESNRLTGVWLLARCADLASLRYDVRRFGACLAALGALGLGARAAALGLIFRRGLYG